MLAVDNKTSTWQGFIPLSTFQLTVPFITSDDTPAKPPSAFIYSQKRERGCLEKGDPIPDINETMISVLNWPIQVKLLYLQPFAKRLAEIKYVRTKINTTRCNLSLGL